jgi:hypothetical protein
MVLSGIILLVFLVVLTSGCIAHTLYDETAFVEKDYEMEYGVEVVEPPLSLDVTLKTDGRPVDLLVLDESNYKIFTDGFTSGNYRPFRTIGFNPFIIETTESYTLPKKGMYYVVIENSDYLSNGANAGRGVKYQVTIGY